MIIIIAWSMIGFLIVTIWATEVKGKDITDSQGRFMFILGGPIVWVTSLIFLIYNYFGAEEHKKRKERKETVSKILDNLESVTRLEVIDARGRSYTNYKARDVQLILQDQNRTLKIFLKEKK